MLLSIAAREHMNCVPGPRVSINERESIRDLTQVSGFFYPSVVPYWSVGEGRWGYFFLN